MYYLVAYTVLGSALMALAMALSYTFTGITSSPHGVESVASVRTHDALGGLYHYVLQLHELSPS